MAEQAQEPEPMQADAVQADADARGTEPQTEEEMQGRSPASAGSPGSAEEARARAAMPADSAQLMQIISHGEAEPSDQSWKRDFALLCEVLQWAFVSPQTPGTSHFWSIGFLVILLI